MAWQLLRFLGWGKIAVDFSKTIGLLYLQINPIFQTFSIDQSYAEYRWLYQDFTNQPLGLGGIRQSVLHISGAASPPLVDYHHTQVISLQEPPPNIQLQ